MAYKKIRTSIWPDGQAVRTELGVAFQTQEDAANDMTLTRENHGGRASTLSIEEAGNTLVVVKEDGVVFVYNWVGVPEDAEGETPLIVPGNDRGNRFK